MWAKLWPTVVPSARIHQLVRFHINPSITKLLFLIGFLCIYNVFVTYCKIPKINSCVYKSPEYTCKPPKFEAYTCSTLKKRKKGKCHELGLFSEFYGVHTCMWVSNYAMRCLIWTLNSHLFIGFSIKHLQLYAIRMSITYSCTL